MMKAMTMPIGRKKMSMMMTMRRRRSE